MTDKDKEVLGSLVAGGVIGAALGALISEDKSKGNGATLGAIAGAALFATLQASENAKKTKVPMVVEENNALYEISSNGSKRKIKDLPKSTQKIPSKFTIE